MDVLIFCHVYCIFPCILKSVCSYLILVKMVQFFGRGLRQYDTFDRRKQQHKKSQNKIDEPPPDTERQCLLKLSIEAMHCNGISGGGGGVVIKLHRMEAFLMSSYICFLRLPASSVLPLYLLHLLGFFSPGVLSIETMGQKRWWRCYQIASDEGDYLAITTMIEATIARLHLALCNSCCWCDLKLFQLPG